MTSQSTIEREERRWLQDHYNPLVGMTIYGARMVKGRYGDLYPVLLLKDRNGLVLECEVLRDEEGNGPGFLSLIDPAAKPPGQQEH